MSEKHLKRHPDLPDNKYLDMPDSEFGQDCIDILKEDLKAQKLTELVCGITPFTLDIDYPEHIGDFNKSTGYVQFLKGDVNK